MKLLTDNPTKVDKYGFKKYAKILADSIINIENEDLPILIGIYGSWGSGKTSFMLMTEQILNESGFKSIWYNPWKFDEKENLWSAFVQTILFKIAEENKDEEKIKKIKRLAGNIAWSLLKTGITALTQDAIKGSNLDEIKNEYLRYTETKTNYINNFEKDFAEAVKEYTGNSKLIVFVDDLDRCLPENAITILESTKLFMDNSDCVFVFGMDRRIVEQGIQFKYGGKINISGREYLDKIIQIPFFVPPVPYNVLITELMSATKTHHYKEQVWDLIYAGFNANPRKTKRFLNSYYFVLSNIEVSDFEKLIAPNSEIINDDESKKIPKVVQDFMLAYLLIIQMQFPDYYEFISRTGDIYSLIDVDEYKVQGQEELINGKITLELDKLKIKRLGIEQFYDNLELGQFLRNTRLLINDLTEKPSTDEIISMTLVVNLVGRSETNTTTTTIEPLSSEMEIEGYAPAVKTESILSEDDSSGTSGNLSVTI